MTDQPEKPDFIVDPAGNARDVRNEKYSSWNEPPLRKTTIVTESKPSQSYAPQSSGCNPAFPIVFIISLVLFIIRLSASASVARNTPVQPVGSLFFERGNSSYDLGNYEDAITQFTTAINMSPEFGEAYNNRGLARFAMGDLDKALADFSQAIQLMPDTAIPYSNRGATYFARGDHDSAFADLEKAIQLNPRFGKAYYVRGFAHLSLGNYDEAIADFDKAIEFTPEEFTRMMNSMPTSENSFASQVTNRLDYIQSYADLPSAYTFRGAAYLYKEDYERAWSDFNKAIDLQPDFAEAYYYRGVAYTYYGERDKAIADFGKVLELNNDLSMQQEAENRLNEMGDINITSLETPAAAIPSDFLDAGNVVMCNVPAGVFLMGSDYDSPEEAPARSVYLEAYAIDKYEVTNKLYRDCVDAGICLPPGSTSSYTRTNYYDSQEFDEYPVVNVDWNMAKTYCEWRGARLPTEAEWEKAARGIDGRTYPWGNEAPNGDLLNYNKEVADTTRIGSYETGKSFYGVYDMAGNVWEWVSDWYDKTYYQNSSSLNPLGPDAGQYRVLRGGSWSDDSNGVRSSFRVGLDPSGAFDFGGFRCARSLP